MLDLFDDKRPFHSAAVELNQLIEDNTLDAFISESVLATVDYILQKITTKETRIRLLSELLEYLRVLSCSTNICRRALQKNYPDLEDAILYQMVFEHAVDYFISNDRGLKKLSSPGLPVVSAKEFLSINK